MVMGFASLLTLVASWLLLRQSDHELCAGAGRAVRRYRASMPVHDFAADGEANAGSFVLTAPVQPLKDLENAVAIFLVKPDAVVLHGNPPQAVPAIGR